MNRYVTKQGLEIIYIKKSNFHQTYCGIGCSYGGANLEFLFNDERIVSPEGVAHFIEHKLFQMPDGSDAFKTFNDLNAVANAYTASDKTLYFFTTTEDIYKPLELLIDMYFTPVFEKDSVEHEKEIIISELRMYEDKPYVRLQKKILEQLYPNDNYSKLVGGTVESVSKTTCSDLKIAYDAFYQPSNSCLVIVSKYEADIIFDFVEKCLSKYDFKSNNVIKLPTVKSLNIGDDFTYKDDFSQKQAVLGIRFAANTDNVLFCNFIIGILDCLFSPMALFYNELYQQKSFNSDIDYVVVTEKNSAYATISTNSINPELFLNLIIEKLKNLSINDLNEEILDLYLRHLKSKSIEMKDTVEVLGDEILSLALEGGSYFNEQEKIANLQVIDFNEYIHFFNEALYLKVICENKKKKRKNK